MTSVPSKFFPRPRPVGEISSSLDFPFAYRDFLMTDNHSPIANFASTNVPPRVAIIGAGIAGLTTALELRRCGVKEITIFEASGRLGGRLMSEPAPNNAKTMYELAAMRMPLFRGDSLIDYYVSDKYKGPQAVKRVTFPNPGVKNVPTGLYVHNGRGLDNAKPEGSTLYTWDDAVLPDPQLKAMHDKYGAWSSKVVEYVHRYYTPELWPQALSALKHVYGGISFETLAREKPKKPSSPAVPDFGGFGLTEKEVWLLYSVGIGDGGWGSFYQVSALWFVRMVCAGYLHDLQLFTEVRYRNEFNTEPLELTYGTLPAPNLRGIQSLPEVLFHGTHSIGEHSVSLWKEVKNSHKDGNIRFYLHHRITNVVNEDNWIKIAAVNEETGRPTSDFHYHAVFVTAMQWSMQLSDFPQDRKDPPQISVFSRFDDSKFPAILRSSLRSSHNIRSGKVFFPLQRVAGHRFWQTADREKRIPQVIVSDTYLQGTYGYAVDDDPGVLLLSYSWEDDANKLQATSQRELAMQELYKLDNILIRAGKESILPYIFPNIKDCEPRILFWSQQAYYRACAKLYHPHSEVLNLAQLSYNERHSEESFLYFAGANYSVEGGWTEPSLRSAMDAVIRFSQHWKKRVGGVEFKAGFDVERDYPSWDVLGQDYDPSKNVNVEEDECSPAESHRANPWC